MPKAKELHRYDAPLSECLSLIERNKRLAMAGVHRYRVRFRAPEDPVFDVCMTCGNGVAEAEKKLKNPKTTRLERDAINHSVCYGCAKSIRLTAFALSRTLESMPGDGVHKIVFDAQDRDVGRADPVRRFGVNTADVYFNHEAGRHKYLKDAFKLRARDKAKAQADYRRNYDRLDDLVAGRD